MSALVGRHFFPVVRTSQTGCAEQGTGSKRRRRTAICFKGLKLSQEKYLHRSIQTQPDAGGAKTQSALCCSSFACFHELLNEFPARANIWPTATKRSGGGKRTAFGALANKLEKLMRKSCDGGCRETDHIWTKKSE